MVRKIDPIQLFSRKVLHIQVPGRALRPIIAEKRKSTRINIRVRVHQRHPPTAKPRISEMQRGQVGHLIKMEWIVVSTVWCVLVVSSHSMIHNLPIWPCVYGERSPGTQDEERDKIKYNRNNSTQSKDPQKTPSRNNADQNSEELFHYSSNSS